MQQIRSIRELAGRYDALLCDVWGVVHDGRALYPGVADALRGARAAGCIVLLLTNVPRPSSTLPSELGRTGLPPDAWDLIVTSGDAIRVELAMRAPGPMHRIGRDTDTALWDGLGLTLSDLPHARFAAIAGLSTADETPDAYLGVLRAARARDLELLCANPDLQVQVGARLVWCAGSVAHRYAALGGRVVQAGKPHAAIYSRARAELDRLAGRPMTTDRILAIGDGIGTDILGANRWGLDSLFIAEGMHGTSLLRGGEMDPGRAAAALDAAGVTATYGMTRLA